MMEYRGNMRLNRGFESLHPPHLTAYSAVFPRFHPIKTADFRPKFGRELA
jgi:hypothetical protein